MEKKGTKRVWAGFLAAVMALGLVSFPGNLKTALADPGDSAGAQMKTVNLQIDGEIAGITDPSAPAADQVWSGTKVYFGKYNNNPVLFRVLDANTTDYSADGVTQTMLLDSDLLFPVMKFDAGQTDNSWAASDVRAWMQGTGSGQFMRQFSTLELNAIIASNKAVSSAAICALSDDTVFALDVAELKNTSYGYSNVETSVTNRIKQLDGNNMWWWTRTPLTFQGADYARFVNTDGKIGNAPITSGLTMGASPAMNLDLSSVLFASVSGQNKAASFTATGDSAANTWNLTLAGGKGFACLHRGCRI